MRRDLRQRRQAAFVALDGDHAPGAVHQERARQTARTGAHFDDGRL